MLATILSAFTWLFTGGGLDKLLALFTKKPAEISKETISEVKNANDRAQRTRGDMRDIDRSSS